ncbi:hypothetical protein [Lewinella sp. W8]|uniref:hypothetical protein n=1 Tax=Lewinella sp. W8 TaxID=2528208 RepID=UPI00106777D8|nr:hypothetical protein [Lewinella sp. W8]MTB52463.1 hypothetical protein [Lewinella sp. W8]
MKNLLLGCLLLCLTSGLSAQCFASFEAHGALGASNAVVSTSGGNGQWGFNNRFGIGGSYRISPLSWIKVGFQFNGYHIRNAALDNLRWGTQHDGQGGFDPNAPSGEDFDLPMLNHRYVEGMVSLRRYFSQYVSPWSPYLEGGIVVGGYGTTTTQSTTPGDPPRSRRDPDLNGTALIGRAAVGVDWQVSEIFSLYAQPTLQYHLRDINQASNRREYPYQLSLEIGMRLFAVR